MSDREELHQSIMDEARLVASAQAPPSLATPLSAPAGPMDRAREMFMAIFVSQALDHVSATLEADKATIAAMAADYAANGVEALANGVSRLKVVLGLPPTPGS